MRLTISLANSLKSSACGRPIRTVLPLTSAASAMLACLLLAPLSSLPASAADLGSEPASAHDVPSSETPARRQVYVRGDVGIGRNKIGEFSQQELSDNGGSFISTSIDDTVMLGAGIGMQVSKKLRLDLTGEYRATAQVKALDNLTAEIIDPDGTLQANTLYQGNLSSYVGLLNVYYDLVNWRGFTPYVGAGIGAAHHKMTGFTTSSTSHFVDTASGAEVLDLSTGTAQDGSKTNLAWALMAGTSFDLSPDAKLDLGYRYLNLGSGIATETGAIDCVCGTTGSPLSLSDIDVSEVRVGIRWNLNSEPRYLESTMK